MEAFFLPFSLPHCSVTIFQRVFFRTQSIHLTHTLRRLNWFIVRLSPFSTLRFWKIKAKFFACILLCAPVLIYKLLLLMLPPFVGISCTEEHESMPSLTVHRHTLILRSVPYVTFVCDTYKFPLLFAHTLSLSHSLSLCLNAAVERCELQTSSNTTFSFNKSLMAVKSRRTGGTMIFRY